MRVKSIPGRALAAAFTGAVLLAAALAADGCGGPRTIEVGEDADGTTVTAAAGDTIVISLAENPTTGYSWNMKLGKGLKLVKTSYEPDDTSGELVGAGGVRTWRIEATTAGEHTVSGVYERPWETGEPAAQTFTLTVNAQ